MSYNEDGHDNDRTGVVEAFSDDDIVTIQCSNSRKCVRQLKNNYAGVQQWLGSRSAAYNSRLVLTH